MVSCVICVGASKLFPFDMWMTFSRLALCFAFPVYVMFLPLFIGVPFDVSHAGIEVGWTDLCIKPDPFNIGMVQKQISLKPPWAARPGYLRS